MFLSMGGNKVPWRRGTTVHGIAHRSCDESSCELASGRGLIRTNEWQGSIGDHATI